MGVEQPTAPADCLACRIIGTGAFALVGLYALANARYYSVNKALSAGPGAIISMRMVGCGFLGASAFRWTIPMRAKQQQVES